MSVSDLPIEPQDDRPRDLSPIGKWRSTLLAAAFVKRVVAALGVHRWRGSEALRRSRGRCLPIVATAALVAATLFALLAWWPAAGTEAGADVASDGDRSINSLLLEGEARGDFKCAQCGVVESTRRLDQRAENAGSQAGERTLAVNSPRAIEVTVRMKDGASHLFLAENSADSASWRPGERVIFIDGRNQAKD